MTIKTTLFVLVAALAANAEEGDKEGGKDLPLLSRYPGSVITAFDSKEFDEIDLVTGGPPCECDEGNKIIKCKTQHLEGKVSWVQYQSPKGRSTLEILRNYQQALQKAGFKPIYSCREAECGSHCGRLPMIQQFGAWKNRYLLSKLSRPIGDVYAAVNATDYENTDVLTVEVKPMQGDLVTVSAAALADDLAKSGHSAVYGIYFDTGKAEVKPESGAALAEVAKLLQQDAKLKLIVAGHTDNVGEFASNMDLSQKRAQAVVASLTGKYGVPAARLRPQGLGSCAPVASNEDEEGRSRNRRVELVKQ